MHRLAVAADGSVYLLTHNNDLVRLAFGPVRGFTVTPGGPSVPLLAPILSESLAVAEVELVPAPAGWGSRAQKARVRRWLTAPPPDTGNVIGLLKNIDEDDVLAQGSGDYILFLRTPTDLHDCEARGDFFSITRSVRGIFEVRDGRIITASLPAYQGWTVDQFAAQLQTLPPPPPLPSLGKLDGFESPPPTTLLKLVQESAFIAEGDVKLVKEYGVGSAGGTKRRDMALQVQTWLKKPLDWTQATIPFSTFTGPFGDSEQCRLALGNNHYILFLYESGPVVVPNEGTAQNVLRLTDFLGGIFAVDGNEIDYGGIRRYWGMPVAQFEQEILAIAGTPAATLGITPIP
jgi:hypothetical protein